MGNGTAIAVLHFNKKKLTHRCIKSVAESISSGTILPSQVFCLDNGSLPDVTDEIISTYPMIQHRKLDENSGFSGGFNAALSMVFDAGFDRCLFLTNDTVYQAGTIQIIEKAMLDDDAHIAAPSIHYLAKPHQIDSIGGFFSAETASLNHYHQSELSQRLNPDCDYIPGTALAITCHAFQVLGGADESFHTYWEDVDLSFRAHRLELRLIRCDGAKILHGVGQTCHKKPYYTTYLFQRNRLKFCRRHLTGETLVRAEAQIRKDWEVMKRKRRAVNDTRRLRYLDQLFELL